MRALTSLTTRSAIMCSRSVSSQAGEELRPRRAMDRSHSSEMLRPPTVTASDSGLSRAPPHAGHGTSRM